MSLANRIAERIADDYILIGSLLDSDKEASIKRITEIVEEEQKREEK